MDIARNDKPPACDAVTVEQVIALRVGARKRMHQISAKCQLGRYDDAAKLALALASDLVLLDHAVDQINAVLHGRAGMR